MGSTCLPQTFSQRFFRLFRYQKNGPVIVVHSGLYYPVAVKVFTWMVAKGFGLDRGAEVAFDAETLSCTDMLLHFETI